MIKSTTDPSPDFKQVIITTDQTIKPKGNEKIVIGVAGKMGYWNNFVNFFTPLYYKKVEVHPQQGQSMLVRIGDLSKALNISTSVIYNLSQEEMKLDGLIKLNNAFLGIDKIMEFGRANPELFDAIKILSRSPTYKAEDLTKIKDLTMKDPKMQNTVIKAAEVIKKNEQSLLPVVEGTYVRKTKDSYGFTIDTKNKIYIRQEEIGEGQFKRVKVALQLPEFKEQANVALKGAKAKVEVEKEQAALKLLQGCRHIVKPPKFQIVTKTKKSEPKYVLMQKKLAGDGLKLFNAEPMKQLQAFRDCAEGLGDIHDKGLIHSDVKLANFLIDSEGGGYVHDFGFLATPQTYRSCTPGYAPPELNKNFSSKFDSYGLGISMLQAILHIKPEKNEIEKFLANIHYNYKNNPQAMKNYFNSIRNALKSSTTISQNDKKIQLKMLFVAEQLLDHDPKTRLSCKEAAVILTAYQNEANQKDFKQLA